MTELSENAQITLQCILETYGEYVKRKTRTTGDIGYHAASKYLSKSSKDKGQAQGHLDMAKERLKRLKNKQYGKN